MKNPQCKDSRSFPPCLHSIFIFFSTDDEVSVVFFMLVDFLISASPPQYLLCPNPSWNQQHVFFSGGV